MNKYPKPLLTLIQYLKKLPGVGTKTAERFAFHLLNWSDDELKNFSDNLGRLKEKIGSCDQCGALKESLCAFCEDKGRDQKTLCIVSSPRDIFLIEETRSFQGIYHVLPHLLSPIEGKNPEDLKIEKIKARLGKYLTEEVIIALDSTLEGDATALYLKKMLDNWGVKTTRLAFGLPVGSSLEFTDEGTLARAFMGRQLI